MTKEYPRPDWAKGQVRRESGLMEDICEHGVGHPNATWLQKHDPEGKLGFSVHGCDFCCSLQNIPDLPGYCITPTGRVWSLLTNQWMQPHEKDGYLWVQLRRNNRPYYKAIHRLVAETFLPNPMNKRVVNHKDFNRQNNNATNLEWATDGENQQYSYDKGRRPNQAAIAIHNGRKTCRLSDSDVINIRKMYASKQYTQQAIADIYNVHKETIGRIIRGMLYKHVSSYGSVDEKDS